ERVSIYVDNDVSGKVTISLNNVTFIEALTILTKNNNLTFTKTDNIYYIKPLEDPVLNVQYTNGKLYLEAKRIKLSSLLETVSQKSGANLVPAPELQEKISIVIGPAPLEDAIQALLSQSNCIGEKIGEVTVVRKKTTAPYSFTVNYQDKLLTIDARDIPLPVLCRSITEKTGISIVPDQNLNLNITVFFQNLSIPDSLAVFCEPNGLIFFKEGDAWRITHKSGTYRVRFKDNLLTVDADQIDISVLAKEIARQTGINIMLDRDVRGMVSAHFQNLPLFQGLSIILENQGWIIEKQPNHYIIRNDTTQNKNIRVFYNPETKLFNIDVKNAPLTQILDEMARKADLNLVVLSQVNWTVNNIRLQGYSFTQVMDFLFKGTIFTYQFIDNTYLVGDGLIVRPENSSFATVKIYPIKYMKSEQMLNSLPPVFPRANFIQIPEKNALVVTGPEAIHKLFTDYLAQIDIATIEDMTEVIKIKHLKAEDVLKLIPPSIPKTDLIVLKEANAIVVRGPQNLIHQVQSYIDKIDQVNPLIVFDINVVQISNSKGFSWNPPSGVFKLDDGKKLDFNSKEGEFSLTETITNIGAGAGSTETVTNLIGSLKIQLQNGNAKIVANPTITTLNGYPAKFNVSTKRNYEVITSETITTDGAKDTDTAVKTYESGLKISITPWVSANNQITMEIKPEISEFGDPAEGSSLPSTFERSSETTIRVNDAQTIVISGLKNTRKEKTVSKVPILGHIPIIGLFFTHSSTKDVQDEFVIVITPTLVFDQSVPKRILEDYNPTLKFEIDPDSVTEEEKKKHKLK
ncbi:MAG: secretin and TonB N-terminal domain-containing protein, partial [Bacteroidota bacterium]